MKKILFTKTGLVELQNEQKQLELQRKEAVINLQTAREMGDLSENAAYKVARAKLSSIDSRLRRIKKILDYAQVVNRTHNDVVEIGSCVTLLQNQETFKYQIVGGYESDIDKNRISIYSPIVKAILNKKINDTVKVKTPSGIIEYKIINIE